MRRLVVHSKEFYSLFESYPIWTIEEPFVPPATEIMAMFTYSAYVSWGSSQPRAIVIDGGDTYITTTEQMEERTFALQAPFNWQGEGFVRNLQLKMLVVVGTQGSLVELDVLDLVGDTAIVRGVSVAGDVSLTGSYYVALVQDLTIYPQSIITKAPHLRSDYNANPLDGDNPDKGNVSIDAQEGNFEVYMPDWAPESYKTIPVGRYKALCHLANVHHMRDGYDLFADDPQTKFFGNRLYLVFGFENAFAAYPLRTAHLNFANNQQRVYSIFYYDEQTAQIEVEELDADWQILEQYLTYMGGDFSHLSHAPSSIYLLQKNPPSPPPALINKYDTINYLVPILLVTNNISAFAALAGRPINLDAQKLPVDIYLYDAPPKTFSFANHLRSPDTLKPWDAVSAAIEPIGQNVTINKVTCYFAFVNEQNGNSYTGEVFEASRPFKTTQDLLSDFPFDRLFFVFSLDNLDFGTLHLMPFKGSIFRLLNSPLVFARNYAAKYLFKTLDDVEFIPNSPQTGFTAYFCVSVETNQGGVFKKLPLTRQALTFDQSTGFVVTDDKIFWTSPPFDVTDHLTIHRMWRVSLHRDEFTSYPIMQWIIGDDDDKYSEIVNNNERRMQLVIPRTYESEGTYYYLIRAYIGITTRTQPLLITKLNLCVYQQITKKRELPDITIFTPSCDCVPFMPITQEDIQSGLTLLLPPKITSQGSPAGDYRALSLTQRCFADEFQRYYPNTIVVDEVPIHYIDFYLYFDNYINSHYINGSHFFRIIGSLRRIDDEIEKESYVTVDLKELDIYRGFAKRYELELFINFSEYLWSIELMKYARTIDIALRQGWIMQIKNLIYVDSKINDRVGGMVVTVTLREMVYRSYYKYK